MTNLIVTSFKKAYARGITRIFMLVLGVLFFIPLTVYYLAKRGNNKYKEELSKIRERLLNSEEKALMETEIRQHVQRKAEFFKKTGDQEREIKTLLTKQLEERARKIMREEHPDLKEASFVNTVSECLQKPQFMAMLMLLGFPAFIFILLMSNPFIKYIFERLVLTIFVVFGVTFLVFTILYISPMDASYNALGELATQEQRDAFNVAYGLDKPYLEQLWNSFKGIATLNPGKSYVDSDNVINSIARRFPVTLQLTFYSLTLAVVLAVPAGILSALKSSSLADYIVMLIALVGLSIPAFWFGFMLILSFSIKLKLMPVIFVQSWIGYVMPAIVMGTGLAASVARMTRSSMLEVMGQDYIVTAKAKGLSYGKVVLRHALGNAMIPIVTVIGIQFGAMMGGATVVEKVFNMPGIGSWLVDKQFIPDIPAVLAGVVYISIIASLANLFVDILYAYLDPRIKAKIKGY